MDFSTVNSIAIGGPYDAEVEYLIFTGTQNITIPNPDSPGLDVDIQMTGANQMIVGIGNATRYRKFLVNASGYYAVHGDYSGEDAFNVLGTTRVSARIYVPKSSTGRTLAVTIDDVRKSCTAQRNSSYNNILLFGNATYGYGSGRLYGVAGYKCVRVGTAGALYNADTGALIYPSATVACGPDTRLIARQTPKAILDENGRILWKSSDFSFVQYLETSGTQWVNTGVTVTDAYTVSVTAQLTNTAANECLWCARSVNPTANTFTFFRLATNSARFDYGATHTTYPFTFNDWAGRHEYKAVANNFYIDGTLMTTATASTFTSGGNVFLMANNRTTAPFDEMTNFATGRLYGAKIIDGNGNTIRDFQPCRLNGVGYLFDKVSKALFGNAGTGAFTYGADI